MPVDGFFGRPGFPLYPLKAREGVLWQLEGAREREDFSIAFFKIPDIQL
jgi:hypothetical protein